MMIEGIEVGGNAPCCTVAEISNSHNGSLERALRMISAAKAAGADFVKFQAYTPSELVALRGDGPAPEPWGSQGWTMRTLYEKAQTPLDWFPALFDHARKIGIVPFSSVFGEESLAVLKSVDCPAYKVASLDKRWGRLRTIARMAGKPVIVSARRVERDVDHRREKFLYCPPGYPQEGIAFDHEMFNANTQTVAPFLGFSYHGTDILPCVVAATLGAKMIEAHFHLRDEPSELEANVSLNEYQWSQMVHDIRATERLLA